MVYYILGLIIIAIIIFTGLIIYFSKDIEFVEKKSPRFWFFLFLISILLFFIFRLILLLLSPDLNPIYTSKFEGNNDYILLLIIGTFLTFFMSLSLILLIFTGKSIFQITKIDYIIGIILIILFFIILLLTQVESLFYSTLTGWNYIMGSMANYYNFLILFIIIYYSLLLLGQRKKIKDKKIIEKFNNFLIGSAIIIFGTAFSVILIEKIFGQFGIKIISLIIGILFISKSFKK